MFARTQNKIRQGASPILWKPRQSASCVTQVEQFTTFPGITRECMQGQGTWEYPWNAGLKPKDKQNQRAWADKNASELSSWLSLGVEGLALTGVSLPSISLGSQFRLKGVAWRLSDYCLDF